MACSRKFANRISADQPFLTASKTYLGWLRSQILVSKNAFSCVRADLNPSAWLGWCRRYLAPRSGQMRSHPQDGSRFGFFKSRQNSNLFKPFDSRSRWGQISRVLLLLRRKKSAWVISAWISGRSDLVEMQRRHRFLVFSEQHKSFSKFPIKCVENSQFFIFRKINPKTLS